MFELDVLEGFAKHPKSIPCRYFYDETGSALFQAITDTVEYYPTRCEFEILQRHRGEIIERTAQNGLNIIELGAGDGRKTKLLLEKIRTSRDQNHYFPIDISESAIKGLMASLEAEMPELSAYGVVGEYFQGIKWLGRHHPRRNLVLFLGSNIGNFDPAASRKFLMTLWDALNDGDYLLIGFDLKKHLETLHNAYNDPGNVTERFNLNLLARMNRELQANFDLSNFEHYCTYNFRLGAMESYLVSLADQVIHFAGLNKTYKIKAFEPIHVEHSFKFSRDDIDQLAIDTGYRIIKNFTDAKSMFVDSLWEVVKDKA